jgi:hypothetical protein
MPVTRVERWARALFVSVLHLYRASYRDEYGREMTLVLVDRLRGEHNAVARVVVFLGAIASVLADTPQQHAPCLMVTISPISIGSTISVRPSAHGPGALWSAT